MGLDTDGAAKVRREIGAEDVAAGYCDGIGDAFNEAGWSVAVLGDLRDAAASVLERDGTPYDRGYLAGVTLAERHARALRLLPKVLKVLIDAKDILSPDAVEVEDAIVDILRPTAPRCERCNEAVGVQTVPAPGYGAAGIIDVCPRCAVEVARIAAGEAVRS